jgi:hypothetical protein
MIYPILISFVIENKNLETLTVSWIQKTVSVVFRKF